ncbi:unnamed protein product [Blepharisma stoltei]|uniref:Uncharacterized protein n=1 Tax=Blepharisma stoltei TaxID=1481888 RepID=A0AAU9IYK1_9CILI|nr:unnamed protein product [Blepharisma stoltei]
MKLLSEMIAVSRHRLGFIQYNASDNMKRMKIPNNCHCLIGIKNFDLYHQELWNFVFDPAGGNKGVRICKLFR